MITINYRSTNHGRLSQYNQTGLIITSANQADIATTKLGITTASMTSQ